LKSYNDIVVLISIFVNVILPPVVVWLTVSPLKNGVDVQDQDT